MILTTLLLVLIGGLTALYIWMKYQYSYWKRKNVAYVEPFPLVGNIKELITMTKSPSQKLTELYNHKRTQNRAAFGIYMFTRPAFVIRDPALAKIIFIKEFNRFSNRFASADPHGDPLAFNNLFFMKDAPWKEMRTKLTPIFTTGKLKQMFQSIDEIGNELNDYLCRLTKEKQSSIQELKEISALYTTDVIASTAYGIRANSLEDKNSDFRRNGKPIFTWTAYKAVEYVIIFFIPHLVKIFRAKVFPEESTKFLRDSISFVMAERAKIGIPRSDLIDILVKIKQSTDGESGKTSDKLIAQAAVFFTAGFETSSSIISFGLHELSRKPDLQKRLREEIKASLIKNDGKITYDSLNGMEYLNMVTQEILRMYPPQPFLDRKCTLANGEKEFSLKPDIDFNIPNGMGIYYPIFAIHRDPKYFPNPDEFDPERFSAENKPSILPFSYAPFGVGPHNCIGERLGILQSKTGLVNFLRNHYAEPCEKSHQTMELDPKGLLLSAKGGIYVNLIRDPLFVRE